jgi:hypothetical protein
MSASERFYERIHAKQQADNEAIENSKRLARHYDEDVPDEVKLMFSDSMYETGAAKQYIDRARSIWGWVDRQGLEILARNEHEGLPDSACKRHWKTWDKLNQFRETNPLLAEYIDLKLQILEEKILSKVSHVEGP